MYGKTYSYEVTPLKVRFTPFAIHARQVAEGMGAEVKQYASPQDIIDDSLDSLAVELLTDPYAGVGTTYAEVMDAITLALGKTPTTSTLKAKPRSGRKAMRWQRRLINKAARRAVRHGREV